MQREPDEDAAWRAIVDNYGERVLEDEDEAPAEPEPAPEPVLPAEPEEPPEPRRARRGPLRPADPRPAAPHPGRPAAGLDRRLRCPGRAARRGRHRDLGPATGRLGAGRCLPGRLRLPRAADAQRPARPLGRRRRPVAAS
ncbi:hypothetical protein G5V59_06700 [Nocardioides sp. W3-2-3]|uniref:hypothetical protein n=1 Tax=Nocardioides convexus TaxID=2712224 RepID=UPI0024187FD3|nr:hypothetical protein [Nocardioides convexus]NHA00003.1 hypothetical protein [Nocardioides convexus]